MSGFYWIASYPKSGNTWLRLALRHLIDPDRAPDAASNSGFAPNAGQRSDFEEALDVESSDLTPAEIETLRPVALRAAAARAGRPLYRKVHDAWTRTADGVPLFPPEATLGALYIVRDPRDVAVSWAHFAAVGLDQTVTALCNPSVVLRAQPDRPALNFPQRLLCWSGHVRSWLDAPGRPCCLLRYEDMLADPAAALRRAAAYAGIPHDDVGILRAVAATRFDALREHEARHGFDGGQPRGVSFFRSGRAGGWRAALTAQQAARIYSFHQEMMERLGYKEYGCA